jgi:hypothetical protein
MLLAPLAAVAADTRNSVYALLLLAVSYPVFRWGATGARS